MSHNYLQKRWRVIWSAGVLLLACFASGAAAAAENTGCEILSAMQVSAIVGRPVEGGASTDLREGEFARHCSFVGGSTRVELSLFRLDNEHAAAKRYEKALQHSAREGSRDEPLHGVGIESRYRSTTKGSTIIARFGVHVVMVTTNAGREAVVGLVRAIGAKVTEQH